MLNYLRYFIVIILFGLLFYTYSISIEPSTVKAAIDKKLPIKIDKKGFEVTIHDIDVLSISNNIIESNVIADIRVSKSSRFGKFLPKNTIHFTILTRTIPKLHDTSLSFSLLSFKINKYIKLKEVKGLLKKKIENIKVPIKSLQKIAWFASIKRIKFQDNGVLFVTLGISRLIIFFLIPLFLLREIGLLLIYIYQKFFSARKKYRCAKGELYQDGTCSSSTKEAFKKYGFIAGIKEYRRSTKQCKEAYKTLRKDTQKDGTSCDASLCSGCSGGSCGTDAMGSSTSVCDLGVVPCDVGSC